MANDEPRNRSIRERDTRVLLRIAGGFFLLACLAGVLFSSVSSHDISQSMSALAIVCSVAATVFAVWALSSPVARGTRQVLIALVNYVRPSLNFIIRLQPVSTRLRVALWVAIAIAMSAGTHAIFLWWNGLEYAESLKLQKTESSFVLTMPADDPREIFRTTRLDDHARSLTIHLSPENPRDIGRKNWYQREQSRRLNNEVERALSAAGWTADTLRAELEQCRLEKQSMETQPPATFDSIKQAIQSFPEISIREDSFPPEYIMLSVKNQLMLSHKFGDERNLWVRLDGKRIWFTQNYNVGTTMFDAERNLTIIAFKQIYTCGNCEWNRGGPSSFENLGACLTAILGTWFLVLAPFFLLRPSDAPSKRVRMRPVRPQPAA